MIETITFILRGASFRGKSQPGTNARLRNMKPGDKFQLVAEPENIHDSNAIMVMDGDWHMGYIAKEIAVDLIFSQIVDAEAVYVDGEKPINPFLSLQYSDEPI